MDTPDQLKTRLVREAVEDNVATMRGRLPEAVLRVRRLPAPTGPRAGAALLFLVLVGGLRFVPSISTAVSGSSAAPLGRVASTQPPPVPAPEQTQAAASFARPLRLSLSALALGVRRVVVDAG